MLRCSGAPSQVWEEVDGWFTDHPAWEMWDGNWGSGDGEVGLEAMAGFTCQGGKTTSQRARKVKGRGGGGEDRTRLMPGDSKRAFVGWTLGWATNNSVPKQRML